MIAHTIQLALAPVFVLVAIGNILNILSTRLGRIVDRARVLRTRYAATSGAEHDAVVIEMRGCDRRIALNHQAIRLLVLAGLAIGTTVATLFFEEIMVYRLEQIAAGMFLFAIGLLMAALMLFLREIEIAAGLTRVPSELLERGREL